MTKEISFDFFGALAGNFGAEKRVWGVKGSGWRLSRAARALTLCLAALALQVQAQSRAVSGVDAKAVQPVPSLMQKARQQSGTRRPVSPSIFAKAGASSVSAGASVLPPQVVEAERFLAERGWKPGAAGVPVHSLAVPARMTSPALMRMKAARAAAQLSASATQALSQATATWQPLGPTAVQTGTFGLVTGRISSLALDPSDTTGNRLYVGTTGGGVWESQNAAVSTPSSIVFTPLTDSLEALGGANGASISIGALTVQPGGTGVILAGTGDPNDALDSYYGAGILRSVDGGQTWTLIQQTQDWEQLTGSQDFSFTGEGFAGFAWSTVNPQLVVAAVSQAYEGVLVGGSKPGLSCEGLYYSTDAGATWHLATITDGNGADVQGPNDAFAEPDGNAATAVVWNPVRQVFVAAVRYHGYYQSSDGVTWTRMASQPGTSLTMAMCPTNPGGIGSIDCPIFRGALAVNPQTGDTFAWTVDINNQDQGLWQDACNLTSGNCGSQTLNFAKQWNTAPLKANTSSGPATIPNGDYNLSLAAVPQQQDTMLLAGANDLWKCNLAMGCVWRNTTNSTSCMSAQVGEFQHAIEWSTNNAQEIFLGNDSGLWRSMDAIGESGPVCDASDATHFQNLNGSLGSLAEPESISQLGTSSYTMLAGLGVNGAAGVKGASQPATDWPQVLTGEGGPVVIDPVQTSDWYVNNAPGVSIYLCSQPTDCTPADFGASPIVDDADVGGDGYTMTTPAPFLVDPVSNGQLLIGTCRVWRGPAGGSNWSASNAISPVLDTGTTGTACNGDALIRSIAAMALPDGSEVIYVGTYGALDGGANIPGHVWRAVYDPSSTSMPVWEDLTLNPVTNGSQGMNYYGFDISSIFIDPHDTTGNTVYVTVEGARYSGLAVQSIYRSTDGGAHWTTLLSNLPPAPASSVVVDPQNASTVYVATDVGVYFTTQVENCAQIDSNCWSAFGTGLPEAPVVALSASPASATQQVLVAATYGRGIWQTPLWSTETGVAAASTSPGAVSFGDQSVGTASSAQTVTLYNTGSVALTPTAITMSGDFSETDNCVNASVPVGGSCAIQVSFSPNTTGAQAGQMTISANIYAGQLAVDLSGTGTPAGEVTLTPGSIDFGQVQTGTTSAPMQVTVANNTSSAFRISSIAVTGPFALASNTCGTTDLAAQSDCQLQIEFEPTQTGAATGTLTMMDGAGTQTVALSGNGATPATDTLSPTSLSFPDTVTGQASAPQSVQLTNSGSATLTSISASVSGPFQISNNNCTTQLAGEASCAISVVFAPKLTGSQTGTLTVSDALRTQTVALSGTGVGAPVISLSPSSLSFTGQQVGVASAAQTLTVSNTGASPMANVGFQFTGSAASDFSVSSTTCGASLNNGSSCTAEVVFTPSVGGEVAATLTVSSSTAGVAPASATLMGSLQYASGLNVSPTELDFAAVNPGQTSAAQTVTVTNGTGASISSMTATASSPFVVTQNGCTGSLGAGASCTVAVAYAPTAAGSAAGTLTISSPAVATASSVALIASGGLQVTPETINFGSTGVGTSSNPTTVTVTNLSTTTAIDGLALNVSTGFKVDSSNCGTTLAAQGSCTVGVEFAPATAGQQTGTLTVTSSTVQAVPVALSGMGFDFTAAVTGPGSDTVASGQTASYTLALTTLDGSQGTFTFQCSSLPAHALCVFSPGTETLGAGAQGNVTVQVSTGQASAASHVPDDLPWHAAPLLCGVFLLPLARKRRRSIFFTALLAMVFCFGAASCTSSGGGTGGGGDTGSQGGSSGTTPAGTYTIQLTASSTGVQHSVSVTLTVD